MAHQRCRVLQYRVCVYKARALHLGGPGKGCILHEMGSRLCPPFIDRQLLRDWLGRNINRHTQG